MANDRNELFSERVVVGKRTYFFDIKEGSDGSKYLVISERIGDTRHRIMVFEEDIIAFNTGLKKAIKFIVDLTLDE